MNPDDSQEEMVPVRSRQTPGGPTPGESANNNKPAAKTNTATPKSNTAGA